jgi:hypothetical protein
LLKNYVTLSAFSAIAQ